MSVLRASDCGKMRGGIKTLHKGALVKEWVNSKP